MADKKTILAHQKAIEELKQEFKFDISLDPSAERVMHLNFEDGRKYRLEHPGAMPIAKLFGGDSGDVAFRCLEYFIKKCILPVADSGTKVLNEETLDNDETLDLWMSFAWRWLRHREKIIITTA